MDIKMGGLNGFEASKRMRMLDQKVILIFITNFVQFAINGYEVNALDFILKPISHQSFNLRMHKAVAAATKSCDSYISIPIAYGFMRIAINDIYYVGVYGHQLNFSTIAGEIETRGRLSDYEKALSGHGFLRCNKSCIINLKYIERVEGKTITIAGRKLYISRNRSESFVHEAKKQLALTGAGISYDH